MTENAEERWKCEVAIIGGGPGGSIAATLLARRGINVMLIDGSTFPREKLCGDFISYDAAPIMDYIGAWSEIAAAGAASIESARVVARGVSRTFALPMRSFALSRFVLDNMLVHRAVSAGAVTVLGATATLVESSDGAHVLYLSTPSGPRIVEAAVVIGAWGRWSRLDLLLRRQLNETRQRHFGMAQYGAARRQPAETSVDLFSFRGGYVGVANVEANRSNLCGLVTETFLRNTRGRTNRWLDDAAKTAPMLALELEHSRPLGDAVRVSTPVIFSPRTVVVDSILTVGDAAMVLPPVVGGGIAAAMQTGLLAADASLRLLGRSAARAVVEREYAANVHRLLSRRAQWAGVLGRLLSHPRLCETVLRLAAPPIIWEQLVRQTRSEVTTVARITEQWRRGLPLNLHRDI